MGYIYMIQNKINGHVYIGQTKQKPEVRWKQHIKVAFSDAPSFKIQKYALQQAIEKYGVDNFDFIVLEEVDNNLLNQREQYWISTYNSYYNGYNETLGGDAVQKYEYEPIYQDYLQTHSLELTAEHFSCSRDTVRAAILSLDKTPQQLFKENHYGRKYDYKQIAFKYKELGSIKETAAFFGCDTKVVSEACKENGVRTATGGQKTQEIFGKPVNQIDINTLSIIKTFPSANNAAETVFNDKSKSRNILACCYHRQKTAYGYGWSFVGEQIQEDIKINKKKKSVVQKNKITGEIINIYSSGIEAARAIGKDESAASVILKVCRNPKLKTAYGYIWEYGDTNGA